MRPLALVFVVLGAIVPAAAFSAPAERYATPLYSACTCHFGYGGNVCSPTVACSSEGGRCERWCQPSEGGE